MKEYKKYTPIGRVLLTINDLSELVALVNSGFPPSDRKKDLSIEATISELNISECDLDSFLKHNELSKTLDNIFIFRIGRRIYNKTSVEGVDNEQADYFKPTDGQTEFILANTPEGEILVFVNGKEEHSYSLSGNILTFIPSDLGYQLTTKDLVKVFYDRTGGIDRSIHLRLNDSSNSLHVIGSDQTWVLGKNKQLTDYIRTKRPSLWFISKTATYLILGAIASIFVIVIFQIIINLKALNPLLPLSILPLALLSYSLWKVKNTNIIIQETKSFWEKNGMVITIILSFLTLVAILIIGYIQIIITK